MSLLSTRSTSLFKTLALTAAVHAVVAVSVVPVAMALPLSPLKLGTVKAQAKNTRPVILLELPPYYHPICEMPSR